MVTKKQSSAQSFATIARIYDKNPRGSAANMRLYQAYQALFDGRGSREDAEIVLVDLLRFSGYLNTTPPQTPGDELKYYEGQRSVYGHIAVMLDPSPIQMKALTKAVQDEMAIDASVGDFK